MAENGGIKSKILSTTWEIIMIVVGILIALGIDDWNSERIAHKDKRELLQNLSVELKENRNKIIYKQWDVRKAFKCLLTLIQHTGPQPKEISDSTFMRFVHSSLGDLRIDFSDAAVLDIINSGHLQLVKDDSCRLLISEWEADMRHDLIRVEYSRNRMQEYLTHKISFLAMDRDNAYLRKSGMSAHTEFEIINKDILSDHVYQNLCEDHLWHVRTIMLYYEDLLLDINKLQESILLEIKS